MWQCWQSVFVHRCMFYLGLGSRCLGRPIFLNGNILQIIYVFICFNGIWGITFPILEEISSNSFLEEANFTKTFISCLYRMTWFKTGYFPEITFKYCHLPNIYIYNYYRVKMASSWINVGSRIFEYLYFIIWKINRHPNSHITLIRFFIR